MNGAILAEEVAAGGSMSTFLANMGEVTSWGIGQLGTVGDTIVATPVMSFGIGVGVLFSIAALFRKFLIR